MKLKLLQIHDYPPFEGGGIEVNVSRLSKYLIDMGYDVTIATGRFTSETYGVKEQRKSFITDFGLKVELLESLEKLKLLINEADIVHIHFTFSCRPASMIAMDYCVKLQKPCTISIRTAIGHIPFSALSTLTPLEKDYKLSHLKEILSSNNVYISAPSEHIFEALTYLNIDKDLTVIRNGITVYDYKNNDVEDIEPVDVTYIGEISFLKGVNYLVDAIRALKEVLPNFKARFIGGGSDFNQIYQLISSFGLEDTIHMQGYVSNSEIPAYLNKTKIYVQASLTEVWSNAIAEALALGIPTIATYVGGIPELTQQGEYAALVPPADAGALAREIQRLITNPYAYKIAKSKALRAKEYFSKTYTLKNQARQLDTFYQKIYESK